MILGFKKQFVSKILDGTKKHTIREDATNRWKEGRLIDMATGVRTKQYNKFTEQICIGTQKIEFKWKTNNKGLVSESRGVLVFIDGINVTNHSFQDTDKMVVEVLAKNDGFDNLTDFFDWFSEDFTGKIIHWTDLIY
jgi:hypothetical protein